MEIKEMAVEWFYGFGNSPDLHMLVDEYHPWAESVWHGFTDDRGTMWISRHEPLVRFMFEPNPPKGRKKGEGKYGGALGGEITLSNGQTYQAVQCWSSNEGSVNRMRLHDPEVAALLPHQVVDITVHDKPEDERWGGWKSGGIAGLYFDLPWVQDQLRTHLPMIDVFPQEIGGDVLDATQSAVIGTRAQSDSVIWVPYPKLTPGKKPDPRGEVAKDSYIGFKRGNEDMTRLVSVYDRG